MLYDLLLVQNSLLLINYILKLVIEKWNQINL